MLIKNPFISKLTSKTDKELRVIIESKDYVLDAKNAANEILKERGIKVGIPLKVETHIRTPSARGKRQLLREDKKYYLHKLFLVSIVILIGAFYLNFDLLRTSRSSLEPLQGKIKKSQIILEDLDNGSRKATLLFSINGHQKLFRLIKNIEHNYTDQKYTEISRQLKSSKEVTVWIPKSKKGVFYPKVFQIDIDGKTVLDFASLKKESLMLFTFMIILGVSGLLFAVKNLYPKKN